ncbi:hypothetical protein ACQPWY_07400 [Pseudonocardia xinjiangensis]|uniref:hypothetical protein n=1 Tax=Pseudonocardia xinjiangensis TaxID=75289 RepID=UPI003D91FE01
MTRSADAPSQRPYFVGVGCTIGYILIASSQSVALNAWLATANVFVVVGIGFVVVTLCFLGIGLASSGTATYRTVVSHPGRLVALNVTSIANWLFYFLAVMYLHPAVAVTLTQGLGPISMTVYSLMKRQSVSRVTLACHAAILVGTVLMCIHVLVSGTTPGPYGRGEIAMGIVIGVLCSVSITATLVLSKTFADADVPASVLLSLRFPLLILTCAALLPFQEALRVDGRTVTIAVAVGLLGVATAAYCSGASRRHRAWPCRPASRSPPSSCSPSAPCARPGPPTPPSPPSSARS